MCRESQDEFDRRGRPIAGNGSRSRPNDAFGTDRGAGVGVGVLVATVALRDQPVLPPAAVAGGLVDDDEAPVDIDLHAQKAVFDRGVAVRADRWRRGRDHRREAKPVRTNARRASVDRHNRVAGPRQRVPEHRPGPRPGEPLEQPARERCPALADIFEAWRHIDVVDRVDRAAADRVVRVVLQEHSPEIAELVASGATGERVERLAPLEEEPLAGDVLLFDPHAR